METESSIENLNNSILSEDDEICKLLESPKKSKTASTEEPSKLSFEKFPENVEEKNKRKLIEVALSQPNATLKEFQNFATSNYGIVADDLRREVWPILAGVDQKNIEPTPSLEDLKTHPEYNQVILDVNRSLKRFPPGIPYEQRIALQDQLTILILRVIMKYPHLRYYQGYHDVAITFLLVVGEDVAFHVMEILSTNHLVECMQETMEPTQRRLMYIYPIIYHENEALHNFLVKSSVGTLFALPWYLTWFGHSLKSYRSVVRLYDFFLASPHLLPLYVTASIILYRADDIFKQECDMAAIHCCLSELPEDLPFEYILEQATLLYTKYPPHQIDIEVDLMIKRQKELEILEEQKSMERRKLILRRRAAENNRSFVKKVIPQLLMTKRSVFMTTAFSIFIGICAYYYKSQILGVGVS